MQPRYNQADIFEADPTVVDAFPPPDTSTGLRRPAPDVAPSSVTSSHINSIFGPDQAAASELPSTALGVCLLYFFIGLLMGALSGPFAYSAIPIHKRLQFQDRVRLCWVWGVFFGLVATVGLFIVLWYSIFQDRL